MIEIFSPAAFGVYLIHLHFIIWDFYFRNAFSRIASLNALILLPAVVICAAVIFAGCLMVDLARLNLFRAVKAESAADWIAERVKRIRL